MASQSDAQKYTDLLQPIRDLVRNWNVNVASQLEDYIDEIAHITISFDSGVTTMNFGEAALLIQGSACVYSRKVEFLHALVYQTMDLVTNKKKQGQATPANVDMDSDLSFAQRMDDDQLLSLDDIPVANNIDMDDQIVPKSVSSVPRTPSSLIPLMDYEKTKSIPMYSNEGELIGSHLDFKMNTGLIHESGTLLLEPLEHMVLQVEFRNGCSFTVDQQTPAHQINGLFSAAAPFAGASPDLPDPAPEPDDSQGDIGGAAGDFDQTSLTPQADTGRRPVRVRITEEQKVHDPWSSLLDPHDPGNGALNKPFKKGVTHRLPRSLKAKKERKRKQSPSFTPSEPLAEFIRKAFYSCSSQFPKNPLKTPLSSEFEGHYWAEQKRRRLQKKRENLALKRVLREPEPTEEDDEDCLDDYQSLAGDHPDDSEVENGFEEAFEGFNQSGNQLYDPFVGVEPMALDDSGNSDRRSLDKVVQSYEDLVRNYVESTMVGVTRYMQQTDLSKKVQHWEERIKPLLIEEEHRSVFDIHKYGGSVIDTFKPSDPKKRKEQLYFREIGKDRTESEICRLFAATLQLANDGNVQIDTDTRSDGDQVVDSMKLTLLSTQRVHEAMSQYTAPSLQAK